MLDAIALYLRYRSSHVTSLRIVTTDLDLLSCTSRKGKTDSDLIRNALLLWNNVVLCAIFERKRVRFRFLRQYAVFCVVLKSLDDFIYLSVLIYVDESWSLRLIKEEINCNIHVYCKWNVCNSCLRSKLLKSEQWKILPFSMCYSLNLAFSSSLKFSSHFWDWQWIFFHDTIFLVILARISW